MEGSESSSAALPVLNWTAARASDVVVQVLHGWKSLLQEPRYAGRKEPVSPQRLRIYCNTHHLHISSAASADSQAAIEWVGEQRDPAAQPVEIIVHPNLDDGFASLFTDLACSLGLILIELMTGRLPWGRSAEEADTVMTMMRLVTPPKPLRELCPGPPGLHRFARKLLVHPRRRGHPPSITRSVRHGRPRYAGTLVGRRTTKITKCAFPRLLPTYSITTHRVKSRQGCPIRPSWPASADPPLPPRGFDSVAAVT